MEFGIWLAIFSTLLAITTFILGFLWQLRTINYHQYITHYLNFLSCYENKMDKSASQYLAHFETYKDNANSSKNAFVIALISCVIFGFAWLSIVIIEIIAVFRNGFCITVNMVYIILSIAALVILFIAIYIAIHPHRKNLFNVIEPPDDVKNAVSDFKKKQKNPY
jgi:amino acid transporter